MPPRDTASPNAYKRQAPELFHDLEFVVRSKGRDKETVFGRSSWFRYGGFLVAAGAVETFVITVV
jgi:hypothetical protein